MCVCMCVYIYVHIFFHNNFQHGNVSHITHMIEICICTCIYMCVCTREYMYLNIFSHNNLQHGNVSRVTYMNELCTWMSFQIWMSHVTYERFVARTNESWLSHAGDDAQCTYALHFTWIRISTGYVTGQWFMSPINEWVTIEWVMSRMHESCHE